MWFIKRLSFKLPQHRKFESKQKLVWPAGRPFKVIVPLAKTNTRKFSFSYGVTPIWNTLPDNIVLALNLNIFKRRVSKLNFDKFLVFCFFQSHNRVITVTLIHQFCNTSESYLPLYYSNVYTVNMV